MTGAATYALPWHCRLLAALICMAAHTALAQVPLQAQDSAPGIEPKFRAPDATGWGDVAGLRYLEAVHGGAAANEALPMVILIHGLGDEPRADWLDLVPRDLRVRIIMPQAPTALARGYSWFPYRAGGKQPAALAQQIRARADQLAEAIATLHDERPTIGLPIVVGFSQGGMLSFALGVHHPDRVALAIPISGLLPEPAWPRQRANARTPLIRALHGTIDATVPIAQARRLVERLRQLGYDATLKEFPRVGHALTEDMRATVSQLIADGVRSP
jgi:phospholipase/carboxylesterase